MDNRSRLTLNTLVFCLLVPCARAAILTGRYQMRSGVYPGVFVPSSASGMNLNETTLAKVCVVSVGLHQL